MREAVEMTGGGKRGKPKTGFPLFPPPLEIAARFPHSHRSGGEPSSPRFARFRSVASGSENKRRFLTKPITSGIIETPASLRSEWVIGRRQELVIGFIQESLIGFAGICSRLATLVAAATTFAERLTRRRSTNIFS
jgi:hypothetical protein